MSTTIPTPPIRPAPAPVSSQKTPESFLQHLEGFFKTAETDVSKVFVDLFGETAAKQFASSAEAILKTAIGKIAMAAVTAVQDVEDNGQKFTQAAAQILSEAKTQGISVTDSIVNMLIELCVQTLKGSFGVGASSAT